MGREVEIQVKQRSTVLTLLEDSIKRFPDLEELLFTEDSKLHSWITILKNGRNINIFDGLKTKVTEGDVIAIFPPVAGGKRSNKLTLEQSIQNKRGNQGKNQRRVSETPQVSIALASSGYSSS